MSKQILSSILLIFLFIPSHALAQGADWATVRAVPAGEKLSIELKTGKHENGKVLRTTDTSVTLQNGKKEKEISRDDVRRVHRVSGASKTKSALIGTGVGAGSGIALGAAAGGCERSCFVDQGTVIGILAVMGAAIGAVTGLLFGAAKSKRALIYEVRN
jgi:hypothetical protein